MNYNTGNHNPRRQPSRSSGRSQGTRRPPSGRRPSHQQQQNQRLSLLIIVIFVIVFVLIIRFILHRNHTSQPSAVSLTEDSQMSLPDSLPEPEPEPEPEPTVPTMQGLENIDTTAAHATTYYTYGTHFNITGTMETTDNLQSMHLVLRSLNEETDLYAQELSWTTEADGIHFTTSDLINEGVNLEILPTGQYAWLIRIQYKDGSTVCRSIIDDTEEDPIDYYTITRNGVNREIRIDSAIDTVHNRPYFSVSIQEAELPEDVYDIAIDAGHGGNDGGAVNGDYNEAELTLTCALALKEDLEALGYKVFLTRDGTEDPETPMAYTMYDPDGRVNTACASRSKYCVSLHLNSAESEMEIGGIQVYTTARGNIDLADAIAQQIKQNTNADYSNMIYNKMADGVYYNTSREYDAADRLANSDALFMIRELGGLATGAYMDGSNPTYGTNLYMDSPQGVECNLIELGYITVDKDLQDILQNGDSYAQAICNALHSIATQDGEE